MGQLTGHPDRSFSKGFILNIDLNRCGFQQIGIDAVLAIRQFVRGFVNEILQIHGTGLFAGDHTGCVADGICLHVGDRAVCYYIALGIHDLPIAFSAVEGQERSEAGIKANQRDIVHIDIISGIQVIFQNLNLIQLGNAVRFIIVMVTNGINLGQRIECCHTGHFCGQIIQLRFHHSAHRREWCMGGSQCCESLGICGHISPTNIVCVRIAKCFVCDGIFMESVSGPCAIFCQDLGGCQTVISTGRILGILYHDNGKVQDNRTLICNCFNILCLLLGQHHRCIRRKCDRYIIAGGLRITDGFGCSPAG